MENKLDGFFLIVKGVALSIACSLLLTILFAALLRVCALPTRVIYPVNQGIKTVSVALGGLLFVRGEKGWLKGGCVGLLFTMLSYLVFSALGGDFSLSWLILAELGLGAVTGALCGIIAVNVRRS